MRPKLLTTDQIIELMLDWSKSGLSGNEFCKQMEVSIDTFNYWKRTARENNVELPSYKEAGKEIDMEAIKAKYLDWRKNNKVETARERSKRVYAEQKAAKEALKAKLKAEELAKIEQAKKARAERQARKKAAMESNIVKKIQRQLAGKAKLNGEQDQTMLASTINGYTTVAEAVGTRVTILRDNNRLYFEDIVKYLKHFPLIYTIETEEIFILYVDDLEDWEDLTQRLESIHIPIRFALQGAVKLWNEIPHNVIVKYHGGTYISLEQNRKEAAQKEQERKEALYGTNYSNEAETVYDRIVDTTHLGNC